MKVRVTQILKGTDVFKDGPLFTTKESVTNGHWLIKKDHIPKNILKHMKRAESIERINKYPVPPENNILWCKPRKDKMFFPLKKIEKRETQESQDNKKYTFYQFDIQDTQNTQDIQDIQNAQNAQEIVFSTRYINFFSKWIPDFSLKAFAPFDPIKPAHIYSGNTLVGLLMPIIL